MSAFVSEQELKESQKLIEEVPQRNWSWRPAEVEHGPWFVDLGDEWKDSGQEEFVEENGISEDWAELYCGYHEEAYAKYIAHHDPAFIARLLSEARSQRERIRVLEEALEFYAELDNYRGEWLIPPEGQSPVLSDTGDKARAALSGEAPKEEDGAEHSTTH